MFQGHQANHNGGIGQLVFGQQVIGLSGRDDGALVRCRDFLRDIPHSAQEPLDVFAWRGAGPNGLIALAPVRMLRGFADEHALAPGEAGFIMGVALALLQTAGQHGPYGHSIAILGVRMLLGLLQAAGQS